MRSAALPGRPRTRCTRCRALPRRQPPRQTAAPRSPRLPAGRWAAARGEAGSKDVGTGEHAAHGQSLLKTRAHGQSSTCTGAPPMLNVATSAVFSRLQGRHVTNTSERLVRAPAGSACPAGRPAPGRAQRPQRGRTCRTPPTTPSSWSGGSSGRLQHTHRGRGPGRGHARHGTACIRLSDRACGRGAWTLGPRRGAGCS